MHAVTQKKVQLKIQLFKSFNCFNILYYIKNFHFCLVQKFMNRPFPTNAIVTRHCIENEKFRDKNCFCTLKEISFMLAHKLPIFHSIEYQLFNIEKYINAICASILPSNIVFFCLFFYWIYFEKVFAVLQYFILYLKSVKAK